jgi:Bacterial archaeo-eukaryotic release factor family 10
MSFASLADEAHGMRSNAASATVAGHTRRAVHLDRGLDAALGLPDPRGVLSVYVTAAPGVRPGRHDHAPLDRVVDSSRAEWPSPDAVALQARVAALDRTRLVRSATPGLAVFVGVDSGQAVEIPLPVAVTPHAAQDRLAHVRPLLQALQRARPAGVVTASAARLAVFEARGRTLGEVDAVELRAAQRLWLRRRGHPGAPSAPAAQPGPSRDRHARRRDERLAAAAASFGARVAGEASVRDWDLVVMTGTQRLLAAFGRHFPSERTPLIEVTAPVKTPDRSALIAAVSGEIDRIRGGWEMERIADLLERPDTIWQAQPVLAALQRRRVERLAIADDFEANQAERLIRHALATGAALSLAGAGALGALGVAAQPRW